MAELRWMKGTKKEANQSGKSAVPVSWIEVSRDDKGCFVGY